MGLPVGGSVRSPMIDVLLLTAPMLCASGKALELKGMYGELVVVGTRVGKSVGARDVGVPAPNTGIVGCAIGDLSLMAEGSSVGAKLGENVCPGWAADVFVNADEGARVSASVGE